MQEKIQAYSQERVDSKACLVTFFMHIPFLLLMTVTGAILGSGLYLLIATMQSNEPLYRQETEYYIDFADGRLEAKDYYNDFTWNDVLATDLILGKTMETLGQAYQRSEIQKMITGDILSDVRYLTITVTGTNLELVQRVSEATQTSLEQFGTQMDEFDRIMLIENNGAELVAKKLFTWRAAGLGMLVFALLDSIWFLLSFFMRERFYTKTDVIQMLDLPAIGLITRKDKRNTMVCGNLDAMTKACVDNLSYVTGKEEKELAMIQIMPCKQSAMQMIEETMQQVTWRVYQNTELNNDCYETIRGMQGTFLMLPWGQKNKQNITDVLQNLSIQECPVLGVILVDVNPNWLFWYGLGKKR